MRIAVLADIHGNILALEAVLTDLAHRKPDLIVDIGDRASGPLWPRETLDRLASIDACRPRQPRPLARRTGPGRDGPVRSFRVRRDKRRATGGACLPPRHPNRRTRHPRFSRHADRRQQLSPQRREGGRLVRDHRDRIAERLGTVEARLVLCGHSHRPDIVKLPGGPLILNPGSIGCPAPLEGEAVRGAD